MENVKRWKFTRPEVLEIVDSPTLTVDVFITCRNGQAKLDLVLAALSLQNYPENLTNIHVIDDGSSPKLVLPKIRPDNSTLHYYENKRGNWGKSKSTNFFARNSKADVLWFLDSDMIVEPSHLSHHMKWHHQAMDYVVLGWKKFAEDWNYDAHSLVTSLKNTNFHEIYSGIGRNKYWEAVVKRSDQLRNDDLQNFRTLVGATFSISNQNWQSIGGYDENFVTAEDTELGWRCILQGMRFVPERDAQSWHLGLSTMHKNRDVVQNHNNPLVANKIPALKFLRSTSGLKLAVPENEFLIDCRFITSVIFFELIQPLLKESGDLNKFCLLANWSKLADRYSLADDEYKDLRAIQRWCENDERFEFETIDTISYLPIDTVLQLIEVRSTPFYFFIEGNLKFGDSAQQLKESRLQSGNGLEGIVDSEGNRFFISYAPAISVAKRASGSTYKNIAEFWGVHWSDSKNSLTDNPSKSKKLLPLSLLLLIRHYYRILSTVESFDELRFLIRRRLMICKDKLFKKGKDQKLSS